MTLETDASDHAIAAILSVTTPNRGICPVAFHSRSLHDAEKNYDTHDKELLAIFEAYKVWQHYLEGSQPPIDTVTDHKNLEYFTSTKKLTCRQARWSEYLSQFNLKIRFRPGRLGSKPDAMTRHWDFHPAGGEIAPTNIRPILEPNQLAAGRTAAKAGTLDEDATPLIEVWDHTRILNEIDIHTPNDPLAHTIIGSLSSTKPSIGWRLENHRLYFEDRIYVPDQMPLHLQII